MGLILDTTFLVRAERDELPVRNAIRLWSAKFGSVELGISVVSLAELAHGMVRAKTEAKRTSRANFADALRSIMPVYPMDEEIAMRAGMIDGELSSRGFSIGLADAAIAATALLRGDALATLNLKHFNLIPGLNVVEM